MKEEMTHERCSELLLAYQQGRLEDAASKQVAEHLEGCPGCAQELRGLRALVMDLSGVELEGHERQQLHAGVRAGLEGAEVREIGSARGWRRHAPQLVAAAAVLAVVAVGLLVWPSPRSGSDLDTAGGAPGSRTEDSFEADAEQPAAKSAQEPVGGGEAQTESLEVSAGEAPEGDAGAAAEAGTESSAADSAAGTLAFGVAAFVTDEPYADARFEPATLMPPRFPRPGAGPESYVRRLTAVVGDARVAELIRTCTRNISGEGSFAWLPTSATYYRPDEILVIGFVRPVRASRILEYELRGWHRDCDHPAPIYRTGRIS